MGGHRANTQSLSTTPRSEAPSDVHSSPLAQGQLLIRYWQGSPSSISETIIYSLMTLSFPINKMGLL